jgi:hypothetical protein
MIIQACSSYTSLTWLKSLSLNTVISLRLPRTANLRSKIALRKPSKVLVKALALADGAIKGASAAEWGKQQLDKEEEIRNLTSELPAAPHVALLSRTRSKTRNFLYCAGAAIATTDEIKSAQLAVANNKPYAHWEHAQEAGPTPRELLGGERCSLLYRFVPTS